MPFSFHSHSGQFCKHAFSTLEEVVQRAVEVGFTHYGLSEHMPRYETEDLYDEETEVSKASVLCREASGENLNSSETQET